MTTSFELTLPSQEFLILSLFVPQIMRGVRVAGGQCSVHRCVLSIQVQCS